MGAPGIYNGEDKDCVTYCARCDEELLPRRAKWLANVKSGGATRKHVDRDGRLGQAKWSPYGAACSRRALKETE